MRINIEENDRFGIVIDSGSSGSRIQIYKWKDHPKEADGAVSKSPPKIYQEPSWVHRVTPGISSFADHQNVKRIWEEHFSKLIEHAEKIIPEDKRRETPLFVLATAGMRLLPQEKKDLVLKEICKILRRKSKFYIPECKSFIEVIDGETEGIYGWLSLNYLLGTFDDYQREANERKSVGFMDMGGASTQVSFAVADQEEITKFRDYLSKVVLKNINGDIQEWYLFASSWLGFGANETRKRYLQQLVNLSKTSHNEVVVDPCLPKNAEFDYVLDDNKYIIKGIGKHDSCLKTMYPLLMKHIPCKEHPCLFNGVSSPKLSFDRDNFVGISEFWYTANDVFHSGGEYNYPTFNEKVSSFCESDWEDILKRARNGEFSTLDPDKYLKDACFKASWVTTVLHEGFELPRVRFDVEGEVKEHEGQINKNIPFKSLTSVKDDEISWTLGKVLLYASGQSGEANNQEKVGIESSKQSGLQFVPGGPMLADNSFLDSNNRLGSRTNLLFVCAIFLVVLVCYSINRKGFLKIIHKLKRNGCTLYRHVQSMLIFFVSRLPFSSSFVDSVHNSTVASRNDLNSNLEEGMMSSSASTPRNSPRLSELRTRSAINLHDDIELSGSLNGKIRGNFMSRSFLPPKRSNSTFYMQSESSNSRGRDNFYSLK